MHPIVSQQIAEAHRAELIEEARRQRRVHLADGRGRRSLRRRLANAGFWIARTADPAAVPPPVGDGLLRIAARH